MERTPRLGLIGSVIAISLAILLPAAVSLAQTVSFGAATDFTVGPGPYSVAIGDLNGDGKPDLAVANSNGSGTVSILLGAGTGAFGAATFLVFIFVLVLTAVAIVNLRRDLRYNARTNSLTSLANSEALLLF